MPKLDRDDGGLLTLGLVGALALAGGLRGRGSQAREPTGWPEKGENMDEWTSEDLKAEAALLKKKIAGVASFGGGMWANNVGRPRLTQVQKRIKARGSQNEDYVGSLMRQRGIPDRGQNADWIGRAWGVGRDSHGSPMWLLDNEDDTFSLVIRDEENGEVIDVDTSPVESWEELDQMLDLATREGHHVSRTLRERND
jgi:hypothetical protein